MSSFSNFLFLMIASCLFCDFYDAVVDILLNPANSSKWYYCNFFVGASCTATGNMAAQLNQIPTCKNKLWDCILDDGVLSNLTCPVTRVLKKKSLDSNLESKPD